MSFTYQRRYTGPLKGVLLDWAGTTMDYGCYAPAVVFMEVFKRKKVPITMEEARGPMGAHKKVHIRQITTYDRVSKLWHEVYSRLPNEEDVEAMIPGTLETVKAFRGKGLKIGSTTGYTGEMMGILLKEAKNRGYEPDSTVCATDVPAGRPEPWMCVQNAMNLGIYPMEAIVKIGDTLPDIEEGLNAGMWTIGLAKTGNEIGLTEREIENLRPEIFQAKLQDAHHRMLKTGAHYVVDTIADTLPLLDLIESRLALGERP